MELNSLVLKDENLTQKRADEKDIKRFIAQGIKDVAKMQKTDGSFGYYSELGFTNIFASIYTIFVLFELEKSRFKLPSGLKTNYQNKRY
ncbi:MAG: hypothetical protein ACTTJC_03050 [Campylobacter sp.]